jgi:hypothetical protein
MKADLTFSIGGLRVDVTLLSLTRGIEEKYRILFFILYVFSHRGSANAHRLMGIARVYTQIRFSVVLSVADPFH